jgi:hypothetical protein
LIYYLLLIVVLVDSLVISDVLAVIGILVDVTSGEVVSATKTLVEPLVVCSVVTVEVVDGEVDSEVLVCSVVMLVDVGTNTDVEAISLTVDVVSSLVKVGVSVTVLVMVEVTVDADVDSVVVGTALLLTILDVMDGEP